MILRWRHLLGPGLRPQRKWLFHSAPGYIGERLQHDDDSYRIHDLLNRFRSFYRRSLTLTLFAGRSLFISSLVCSSASIMMHSAFFFSLLAGTAVAQYGESGYNAPVGGSKPASTVTQPAGYGSTPAPNPVESLLPIAPIVSVITSALDAIPSGFLPDDDLPAPYKSIFIPPSELFNSAVAPAFTEGSPLLSLLPVYSSTPSSSDVKPTTSAGYPVAPPPVESSKPATSTTCTESKAQSTRVPLDATTSSVLPQQPTRSAEQSVATSTVKPSKPATSTTCTKSKAQSTRVPLDATTSSGLAQYPTGTASAVSVSSLTGTSTRSSGTPRPTKTGRPDYFHGGSRPQGSYGWGRPRPSGKWPHAYPKPTPAFHYPTKPSAAAGKGGVKASSTPCTLETRVRPKATAPAH
jgi:hypothetical protein